MNALDKALYDYHNTNDNNRLDRKYRIYKTLN